MIDELNLLECTCLTISSIVTRKEQLTGEKKVLKCQILDN